MKDDNQIIYALNRLISENLFQYNDFVHTLYILNNKGELIGDFQLNDKDQPQHLTFGEISPLFRMVKSNEKKVQFFQVESGWTYFTPVQVGGVVEHYLVCCYPEPGHRQLIQFLIMLGDLLSTKLQTYRSVASDFLASTYQRQLCEKFSEGYMTINRDGLIMYLNQSGANILGLPVDVLVGSKIGDHIEVSVDMLEALRTRKGWQDKEVFVKLKKGKLHLIETVIPLISEYDEELGLLIIFKEMKSMRKMVNDMVGSKATFTFEHILHESKEMGQMIEMAKMAAQNDSSIMIEGESGTGKELLVQAIHNYSSRRNGPFVAIDCSSIPRELVESELFGYVDGAFTGARKGGRMGKFELANGGTVFLDEIGEMPLEMQARLLRVLQNRSVVRVGGHEPIPIDIRVVAATNRDLEEEVKNNNFRLDLYFRLNVIHLTVPSLRKRHQDIPLLIHSFLEKAAKRERIEVPIIRPEAMRILEQYSWPGNVRELENVMERAVVLSNGVIGLEHLPERLLRGNGLMGKKGTEETVSNIGTPGGNDIKNQESFATIQAVRECNGNITLAAKKLGISRTTLYKRLRKANFDTKPDLRFVPISSKE
ncbi:sigma 54-interacting transcriptional regulator [Bacillus sp. B15-48]|uniref:sigma-54 interaction domain-containing protein n=1 Tax=Bacillus sp. B15-48 TaxID=1548601 RepID=UPI00193F64EF|nr:sigma 54-interacting transcriptional regulator [Bacillus sp. B15-48]MBM4764990.1 PAS domain-containing protein [Bacillus sp. B15-48]